MDLPHSQQQTITQVSKLKYLINWKNDSKMVVPINLDQESMKQVEKSSFVSSECRHDYDGIELIFKSMKDMKQEECSKIALCGYGAAFEDQKEHVARLQLFKHKLSCHLFDTTTTDTHLLNMRPIHVSHVYDAESDSLVIYLIDRELCIGLRKYTVVVVNQERYDIDLKFNCDSNGNVFAICIRNPRELLPPIEEFGKND